MARAASPASAYFQLSSEADAPDLGQLVDLLGGARRRLLAAHPVDDRRELAALDLGLAGIHLEDADAALDRPHVHVRIEQAREELALQRDQEAQERLVGRHRRAHLDRKS